MKTKSRLSIVIVSFESAAIIADCLQKINLDKYQVFVVDNNSQDKTAKIIQEDFPQVNLIKLKQNIGYGRANNVALNQVETDYALILNPDAFMPEKDLDNVIEILDKNQNVALASPMTFHSKKQQDELMAELKNQPQFVDTDFVVGGVMFMNMKNVRKIGFFDENIFMFSEDNEISMRSIDSGYKNILINNSFAFHSGAGSSKKTLRTIYRRFWHLGWSKSYWKSRRKNWISVKRSTLRLVIIYLFETIVNIFKFNKEKIVSKFAFAMGCAAHFIGLKAFNKNGKARG